MIKNPIISIIVPVYKADKYLNRCIDSILAQTFTDFELILVDDGSPDNSGNICDEYAKKDNRVRVIHKGNEGPAKARNTGIENSKGEFIGFIDSDDYIESTMYQELFNSANIYHSDMVVCGYSCSRLNEFKVFPPIACEQRLDREYIKNVLIKKIANSDDLGMYSLWNKLFRKSIILDNHIRIDESLTYAEDWFFNINMISFYSIISAVDKCLYHYLPNMDGLYSKYRDDFFQVNHKMRLRLKKIYEENNISEEDSFKRDIRYYWENIRQIVKIFNNSKNPKKLIKEILQDQEMKNIAIKILSFDRKQLLENSMSRKNKIFPFMICCLPSFLIYTILINTKAKKYLIGVSDVD